MNIWRKSIAVLLAAGALAGAADQPTEAYAPVLKTDFPDPFILRYGNGFFAYATNTEGANVQMAMSRDLKTWELLQPGGRRYDALPVLPKWAAPGKTWAPEVLRLGDSYVLYFTAQERRSGQQCVGVAVSLRDPRGPFTPVGETPLICQRDQGGTIDPSPFRDADDKLYLLFKSDGNNPRYLLPSRIFIQPLSEDGLSVTGQPTELIRNDQHWEWRVVESPTMIRDPQGRYVLLFSANHFGWEADQRLSNYAVGYARCASVTGPCVKAPENPILSSYSTKEKGCLSGPGHQTVFEASGAPYVVFHAWSATAKCRTAGKGRYVYIAPLGWKDGTPVIAPSLR